MPQEYYCSHFSSANPPGHPRWMTILFLLLLITLLSSTNAFLSIIQEEPQFSLPQSEFDALYDLYQANRGEQWSWKNNTEIFGIPWNFTQYETNGVIPHICQDHDETSQHWQGIECSSNCSYSPCHIISLSLSNYNLEGTLPPSINNLTWLTLFDVSNNLIYGTIPPNLYNLSYLSYFSVSTNHLRGSIPDSIYSLSLLQHFAIDHNYFTGTLNDNLGLTWPLLNYFNIENLYITGTLPSTLLNLYYLEYFYINQNAYLTHQLQYPLFSNITTPYLKELHIQEIPFVMSTIPDCYYTLTTLTGLAIGSSQSILYGSISEQLSNLINLELLSISYTSLTGSIPQTINKLMKLQSINFIQSQLLSGTLPDTFNDLKELTNIYFFQAYFTGTFPYLDYFPKLERLQLSCHFTGSLPSYMDTTLGKNVMRNDNEFESRITYYSVSNNHFNGSLSESLSRLTSVQHFDVSSNELTSSIPESLFTSWSQVQDIYVSFNHLTGTVPSNLFTDALINLKSIDFGECKFIGPMPKVQYSDASQSKMTQLYMSNNELTGSITSDICNLINIQSFSLSGNNFIGSLPDCFFHSYSHLFALSLDNNYFTGNFQFVSNWIGLGQFVISNNKFTGTIPADGWNLMTRLSYVSLENNFFSKTFPNKLFQFNGTNVDVTNNLLTGFIPFDSSKGYQTEMYFMSYNEFNNDLSLIMMEISHYITSLQLIHNQFTGKFEIVPKYANRLQLSVFDVGINYMTG